MKLYHGTCGYFDRFDASLRGSGEGASFLIKTGSYLTESVAVADAYRKRLSHPDYEGTVKSYWLGNARLTKDEASTLDDDRPPVEQLGSVLEVTGVEEQQLLIWEGGVDAQPFDVLQLLRDLYSEEELAAIDEFIATAEEAEDISMQFDVEETVDTVMLYGPGETAELMQDTSREDVDWSILEGIVSNRGLSLPPDDDHHAGQALYGLVVSHTGSDKDAAEWLSQRGIYGVIAHLELPLGDAIPEKDRQARTVVYWEEENLSIKKALSPDEITSALAPCTKVPEYRGGSPSPGF